MRIPIPRLLPILSPLLLLCAFTFTPASANSQAPAATIGTLARYSTAIVGQNQYIGANDFLVILELQLARSFSNQGLFNYIGRLRTEQIFHDHNIPIDSEFYSSSTTLHLLQPQSDFIILIDTISPSQTSLRLIDMTTGYVRANEACIRPDGFNGHRSTDHDDNSQLGPTIKCLKPFLEATIAALQRRNAELSFNRPANSSITATPITEAPAPEKSALSLLDTPPNPDIQPTDAQKQQIADLTTQFRLSLTLLDKQNSHWEKLRTDLAAQGLSLRADVKQALDLANSEASRCSQLKANYDVDGLTDCLSKLSNQISRLSSM
jgi:hypothetical protein